jgi:hypothetical protein
VPRHSPAPLRKLAQELADARARVLDEGTLADLIPADPDAEPPPAP